MNRLLIACLAWLTMTCTIMGLTNLIAAGAWQLQLAILTGLMTLVMGAVMAIGGRRRPGWAGLVAVLAALLVWLGQLCAVTGSGHGLGRILPTPAALRALADRVSQAVVALPDYGRPANAADLFLPLGLVGLGAICLLALFLALVLQRPVWIGVPVAASWAVFLSGNPAQGLDWTVASLVAYLLLVSVSARKGRAPGRFRPVGWLIALLAGALGVAGATLAPNLPGWGAGEEWLNVWGQGGSGVAGIDVEGLVPVDSYLRQQQGVPLFRTQGDYDGPMRVGSLRDFDGHVWSSSDQDSPVPYRSGDWVSDPTTPAIGAAEGGQLPPELLSPWWQPGPSIKVALGQMGGRALPVSLGPYSVREPGTDLSLLYDADTDSVLLPRTPSSSDRYTVLSLTLDRSFLEGIGSGPIEGAWQPAGGTFRHADQIGELARSVVDGAQGQDGELRAIEAYLKGPDFRYTLNPQWEGGDDPVWAFLTDKSGYCVHFATAMVEMATTLGIPMRVAVGYLPGELGSDGWRTVTGAQAHMWPQAYFPDIGWVDYDPTPVTGEGGGPEDPVASATASASPTPSPTATPSRTPSGQATGAARTPGSAASAWSSPGPWVVTGAGLVLVAALVWLVRLLVLRRYGPERAWRAIGRAAARRGLIGPGTSPRAGLALVAERIGRQSDLAQRLEELRDQVELARYGPPGLPQNPIPGRDLWALKKAVRRCIRQLPG